MSYFKVSYLLKNQDIPPFVLGSFVSRSMIEENYISTEASFKASRFSSIELSSYKQLYLDKLNNISFPFVWELVNTSEDVFKAKLRIENDLALTKERFFYKLYYSIITNFPWLSDNELNDQKNILYVDLLNHVVQLTQLHHIFLKIIIMMICLKPKNIKY